MFVFGRCMFQPATFRGKPLLDKDLKTDEVYSKFTTNQKFLKKNLTAHVDIGLTIQVGRRALGDVLWQRILKFGGNVALQVAAEVIEDYLFQPDQYKNKDLQLSLVTNIVKEVATETPVHQSKYCSLAQDFIRKLAMDPPFKEEVESRLLNTGDIYEPWLIVARKAA